MKTTIFDGIAPMADSSPFKGDYKKSPQTLLITTARSFFTPFLNTYQECLKMEITTQVRDAALTLPALQPPQIQEFLYLTLPFDQNQQYSFTTGPFLSGLMQKSHGAGHDDFMLNVGCFKPISYLCQGLEQAKDRHLRVIVKGKAGVHCANRAVGGLYYIEEAENLCAQQAQDITIISSAVDDDCAAKSTRVTLFTRRAGDIIATNATDFTAYLPEMNSLGFFLMSGNIYVSGKMNFTNFYFNQNPLFHTPHVDVYNMLKQGGYKIKLLPLPTWNSEWSKAEEAFTTLDQLLERVP